MNVVLIAAAISGAVSVAIAVLAHTFSKERDRESDWRKLKLEAYKEYVLSFSRVVGIDRDESAPRRYADAVNSFSLIAPPKVLTRLYALIDEIHRSDSPENEKAHELLNELMRAMRLDCHPDDPEDSPDFVFRVQDIPAK